MYTALVALPGSGNASSCRQPACASCEAGLGVVFLEFASLGECPGSHTMLHDVEWYHQQYAARYVADVTPRTGRRRRCSSCRSTRSPTGRASATTTAASFPEYSAAYDVHRAEGEGCTYASLPMYVSDSEHYQIDVRSCTTRPRARPPAARAGASTRRTCARRTRSCSTCCSGTRTSTRTCRSGPTPKRSTRTRAPHGRRRHVVARIQRLVHAGVGHGAPASTSTRRASPACTACGYTGQSPSCTFVPGASASAIVRARRLGAARAPRRVAVRSTAI